MKVGDIRWIADRTRVAEVTIVLDMTMNFHNPRFEVKEIGRNSWSATHFKSLSELYETKKEALQVAIAVATKNLEKAETNLACAKGELRWARHDLKHLQKELEKENKEPQNGQNQISGQISGQ